MSAGDPSLPDKVVAVDERLRGARIAHAFGGALALAYYAEPRVTIDIDLNVFVAPGDHDRVMRALATLGVEGAAGVPGEIERKGQCRLWWGRTPLDVFFAYDPLHEEMRARVRRVPFAGTTIEILAPEHLAVCKALLDRTKDWLDIEQMLVCVDGLDSATVERWLGRFLDSADARIGRFQRLAEEYA